MDGGSLISGRAAVLAGLPLMTPARLRRLLAGRTVQAAWADVTEGRGLAGTRPDEEIPEHGLDLGPLPPAAGTSRGRRGAEEERLAELWARAATSTDVAGVMAALTRLGATVDVLGRRGYPPALGGDHQAPAVLFSLGRRPALDSPRVAVVGTRSATHYGEDVACELGAALSSCGVAVVSGLAAGIDGCAHRGALGAAGAPPVGVVGSGLDVPYPGVNAGLWRRVAERGLLLSEAPLGASPSAWRFPARNRVIAALAQVLVVVESHRKGGALHTVEAAAARGVPVMAVPGSVRSPASAGTNALLADGAEPVRDAADVLTALHLQAPAARAVTHRRPAPSGVAAQVLAALDWEPTPLGTVLARTGRSLGEVAVALDDLDQAGWLTRGDGWSQRRAETAP